MHVGIEKHWKKIISESMERERYTLQEGARRDSEYNETEAYIPMRNIGHVTCMLHVDY